MYIHEEKKLISLMSGLCGTEVYNLSTQKIVGTLGRVSGGKGWVSAW